MVVFYDATGKIVGGCEANSPDVVITQIPDGCQALYLDDVANPGVWNNMAEYTIQDGVAVSTPIPDSVKLDGAKQNKMAAIQAAYETATTAGFQSSATGTTYTYFNDLASQVKFNALMNRLNLDTTGAITTIPWLTTSGMVNHTRAQFIQVFDDGVAYEQQIHAHLEDLNTQIQNATTTEAVNAITW